MQQLNSFKCEGSKHQELKNTISFFLPHGDRNPKHGHKQKKPYIRINLIEWWLDY